MRALIVGVAGILLSAISASAGGNSAGFSAGFGNALPQAQAQSLCADSMRREMQGGPPAPAWCGYGAPQLTVQQTPRPLRCETNSYYSVAGVPQYTTTCY